MCIMLLKNLSVFVQFLGRDASAGRASTPSESMAKRAGARSAKSELAKLAKQCWLKNDGEDGMDGW